MSAPAVLVATAKLRPGTAGAFDAWQARHNMVLGKFPGFVSSDVIPPSEPEGNQWTIILNFCSEDELTAWQRSSQRAEIVGEAIPLFEGGTLGEIAHSDRPGEQPGLNVTEVILSKIKPAMDNDYREWAMRIQAAQAKYPGYRGMYLQPTARNDVFDDAALHSLVWLVAIHRKKDAAWITPFGLGLLATLFAIEVGALWRLLPW